MIREKDVIRMKVPFPDINAGLAVQSHMYICRKDSYPKYDSIKRELAMDGYATIAINEDELVLINSLITKI